MPLYSRNTCKRHELSKQRVVLRGETNRKSTLNYERKKQKARIREVVGLGESWEQGRGPLPGWSAGFSWKDADSAEI